MFSQKYLKSSNRFLELNFSKFLNQFSYIRKLIIRCESIDFSYEVQEKLFLLSYETINNSKVFIFKLWVVVCS